MVVDEKVQYGMCHAVDQSLKGCRREIGIVDERVWMSNKKGFKPT